MNNCISTQEILESFQDALTLAGITITEQLHADGNIHRARIEGHRPGTRNLAYVIYASDRPAGWFKDYKGGIESRWSFDRAGCEPITSAMLQQIEADRQERQIEQQERQANAADKAIAIWRKARPVTQQSEHTYLVRKSIQPYGIRLSREALVIPIFNADQQLINLQFIQPDGIKRFLSGGKKKGCYSVIGKHEDNQPIVICEGWATGASLHEHTGHMVIVALDAGNLEPVAKAVRIVSPTESIIIAGDNDPSGVGQNAARAAALAAGGKYLLPAMVGQDWNDLLTAEVE